VAGFGERSVTGRTLHAPNSLQLASRWERQIHCSRCPCHDQTFSSGRTRLNCNRPRPSGIPSFSCGWFLVQGSLCSFCLANSMDDVFLGRYVMCEEEQGRTVTKG
jgi:hypothetical protein